MRTVRQHIHTRMEASHFRLAWQSWSRILPTSRLQLFHDTRTALFATFTVDQCLERVVEVPVWAVKERSAQERRLTWPHLAFTTSISSSSFTLPSTTQEHAAQSVPQEQLQEHLVHAAHLQAPSVDVLRHQESLWREDLLSGGNPRTRTPTGYEPKELATVSRIEAYSGDPYQLYDAHEKIG